MALGVKAVEKHFTDDTTRLGPDHSFSMDPVGWKAMVDSTRLLEASLGGPIKQVENNEKETVILQRRAVRAIRKISAGEKLDRNMIEFQLPCPRNAMKPNEFASRVGKKLMSDVEKGEYLKVNELI